MTTYVLFVPSLVAPPQFQATLDGNIYTVVMTWNLYSQRYYVNIYDQNATLVLCLPLIGSPPDYDISMTRNYFTSTLVYRVSTGNFEINP